MEASKKRNQIFQYLEAIGILMVIDDHTGTTVGIMSGLFPYNSFYMPMFVFISGYFYREQSVLKNVGHKARHLLLPYLLWGGIGNLIAWIMMRMRIVNWYTPLSFKTILSSLTIVSLSPLTDPSWFVVMLFWVAVVYNLLHIILRIKARWMDYAFSVVSVIIGFGLIYLCMNGYAYNLYVLFFVRTFWYMQFYHAGVMFHRYCEKRVSKWPTLLSCTVFVMINAALLCVFGDSIRFNSTAWMASFHSWWLPVVTSITGILFWYKVMQFLSDKIGQLKAVDYIAENTFTIMCTHFFFSKIPDFYAYFQSLHGNAAFADFPAEAFQQNIWNGYGRYATSLLSFFTGVFGSFLVVWIRQRAAKLFVHETGGARPREHTKDLLSMNT